MNILLNDKPCKLLLAVSKQNNSKGINEIGKQVYATYKSRWEVITELERLGFVYIEKFGREAKPFLTPKGKEILGYINKISSI
jgi:predicted transcriptional regulator